MQITRKMRPSFDRRSPRLLTKRKANIRNAKNARSARSGVKRCFLRMFATRSYLSPFKKRLCFILPYLYKKFKHLAKFVGFLAIFEAFFKDFILCFYLGFIKVTVFPDFTSKTTRIYIHYFPFLHFYCLVDFWL